MKRSPYIILKVFILLLSLAALPGCEWLDNMETKEPEQPAADPEPEKVLLLYSAGYNSLRGYLLDDIKDLKEGWLPGTAKKEDVLLVYTHTPKSSSAYNTPTNPYLIRLYRSPKGDTMADTLVTFPAGTVSSSAKQLNEVLSYVRDIFPAKSYGMIFSSHATGYLPAGYYQDPLSYTYKEETARLSRRSLTAPETLQDPTPVPYIEPEYDPSLPMVKSIGQDVVGSDSYEMELADFAAAIPMKLDYILFDACLMGGAEVAYELRGKTQKVGFSQAEVLAEGLNYKELTKHLLKNGIPDPQSVCQDYFTQYNVQTGVYRSATISLIDCDSMDSLAAVCKEIFSAHREGLANINPSKVQGFFRYNKHYFYDLESIAIEAGATEKELSRLRAALSEAVLYKGSTPYFMQEFKIDVFSGLSMYLPCNGGEELDKYYRTLSWNRTTELVEYQK